MNRRISVRIVQGLMQVEKSSRVLSIVDFFQVSFGFNQDERSSFEKIQKDITRNGCKARRFVQVLYKKRIEKLKTICQHRHRLYIHLKFTARFLSTMMMDTFLVFIFFFRLTRFLLASAPSPCRPVAIARGGSVSFSLDCSLFLLSRKRRRTRPHVSLQG